MAIFGAGSKWQNDELKDDFYAHNNYVIGWDINNAEDLYAQISSIKAGDIIYLKSNSPGSFNLKIKGIGIVKQSFLNKMFESKYNLLEIRSDFQIPVEWIVQEEFKIEIPKNIGKLTNVRAATLYEEFLPFVQTKILDKVFQNLKSK